MDDLADCRAWQTGGPRRRSVPAGQHEHRNLPRGRGLVFADGRRLRDQLGPQLGAGAAVQLLRHYRERIGTHLDCDTGVGLEVVVPVRVGGRSAVGGGDREAAVWLGLKASGVTRSIPDLAPMWWMRIIGVPAKN